MSLYGLGIPPAQYAGLAGGRHMADVLKERLGALACDHSLSDNYFARQAFGRSYADPAGKAKLPPYLDTGELEARCARLRRPGPHRQEARYRCSGGPPGKQLWTAWCLLDAQDWMDKDQINALWAAITHARRSRARASFSGPLRWSRRWRTKVDATVLERWSYHGERSRQLGANDRSAIYGGFHMYELR
jgi:S-adenosylmethionine-diacylglycerol 3-amino-3-carboxypropyl transferase